MRFTVAAHPALSVTLLLAVLLGGCATSSGGDYTQENIYEKLQEAFITAQDGEVIELPAGEWHLRQSLSLSGKKNITLKGAGMNKTVFSFKNQQAGAEGLHVDRCNGLVLEDFGVRDMDGDGVKVTASEDVTMRRLSVAWSAGPDTANGGYGLYPIQCRNLLVEACDLRHASDAGLYVGQCRDVVIRRNQASANVQGLAIENCINVEAFENEAFNNTVGIGMYNLPDLPLTNGYSLHIHHNDIYDNNQANFGAPGAIVGEVPAGTGLYMLACKDVRVHDNTLRNHQTANIAVISYRLTGRGMSDPDYNPYSTGVSVYDNSVKNERDMAPDTTRQLGQLVAYLFKGQTPHVVVDGFVDQTVVPEEGAIAPKDRICVRNNGDGSVAMLDAPNGFEGLTKDPAGLDCQRPKDALPSNVDEVEGLPGLEQPPGPTAMR